MTHQVFISYSQKDLAVAQAVCAALEQDSIPCWIAPRDIPPSQDWPSAITQAIRSVKLFILILSKKSNSSDQVQREVQLAIDNHVPILPLRLDDFQLSPNLQYYLSNVQWLKAYPPPAKQYLHQILQTARQALGLAETAVAPTAPPALQTTPLPSTTQAAPKNNLPLQLTSFIGREQEIAQVQALLVQHRLVTLTGVGGTGKTRLSLQVATRLLDSFPDGVRLVELAPLANPALIAQTVITALGQVEQPGKTPIAFLESYLQPKHLLLILDNCEHLVEACAALAASLVHSAPQLTILASSREILGVEGEVPFRVPPLAMSDPRQLPPLEELARFDAVRLFVERAQVVSPGFTLTDDNATTVAQICQRLDGIPLAIELATARLRVLSASQIAMRLNDAFRLLTGGARTALPRHQTLQALIDWSYNLLSEPERALLRSLSVFAGGWTLEAAEEVGGGSPDILDLLGQLADKSLILTASAQDGEVRYHMLETIRQYAHTRLVEAGEATAVRTRHLAYYLRMAETLEPKIRGREQIPTLDFWEGEMDNLRLALEWGLQTDIEAELRMAASLQWFWDIRCHRTEGIAWLQQGLAAETHRRGSLPLTGTRALIRAKTLTTLGFHNSANTKAILEEAITLYRTTRPADPRGLAWALVWLGRYILWEGDLIQTRVLVEEALSLFTEAGDPHGMAECLQSLGNCEIDPAQARKFFQEQLAIDKANGDTDGIANALFFLAGLDLIEGNYENAFTSFEASQEYYSRVGNPNALDNLRNVRMFTSILIGDPDYDPLFLDSTPADYHVIPDDEYIGWRLFWKIIIAFAKGRYDKVAELNEEVWRISKKTDDPDTKSDVLYHRARLARLRGDIQEARHNAEESLNTDPKWGVRRMRIQQELGHLSLQDDDLRLAYSFFMKGFQDLLPNDPVWIGWPLDGLAVLAVRQGKLERAARLFGTRLWRGWAHALSPIERAERDADFAALTTTLGEERFTQLREEGLAMPFMQVLALAQED